MHSTECLLDWDIWLFIQLCCVWLSTLYNCACIPGCEFQSWPHFQRDVSPSGSRLSPPPPDPPALPRKACRTQNVSEPPPSPSASPPRPPPSCSARCGCPDSCEPPCNVSPSWLSSRSTAESAVPHWVAVFHCRHVASKVLHPVVIG